MSHGGVMFLVDVPALKLTPQIQLLLGIVLPIMELVPPSLSSFAY